MSQEIFIRGMFSGMFSLGLAWAAFSRYDSDVGSEVSDEPHQKYTPYILGWLLPVFLLAITALAGRYYGVKGAAQMALSTCFGIFLQITVYYMFLLVFMPLIRKRISARACAMLWVIPNYLYIMSQSIMELPSPKFVLYLPGGLVRALSAVWLAGFGGVLIFNIGRHMTFRHAVLKNSRPVTDGRVLDIFNRIISEVKIKKPRFRLVFSPTVKSPLSVGLFRRRVRVILPEREYTRQELELILRHEIVHIAREDAWSKFFIVFCTAMCWFNPFMWAAMKQSARDMELSCDETVLLGADDAVRKKYASLILDSAGDDRGFTTCLSASAQSLKYRLKNIVSPAKRTSGAIVVGAVFFALCMSGGYVALAYGSQPGSRLIFGGEELSEYTLRSVSMAGDEFSTEYLINDRDGFMNYLAGLELSEITGGYSMSDSRPAYSYVISAPQGTLVVTLYSDMVKVTRLWGDEPYADKYYIRGGIDWDYVAGMITPCPAARVNLTRDGDEYGDSFNLLLDTISREDSGQTKILYSSDYPEGEGYGVYTSRWFDRARFTFSMPPAGDITLEIQPEGGESEIVVFDSRDKAVLQLPYADALYRLSADFWDGGGRILHGEFVFEIADGE